VRWSPRQRQRLAIGKPLAYTGSVKVAWDAAKNLANRRKHGLAFEEAQELFLSGRDYVEIFDDAHSDLEDRFIAIGPIARGLVLVVWTERDEDTLRIISARWATKRERSLLRQLPERESMTDIPELTPQHFERAISARVRRRLMLGQFNSGEDFVVLRRFVGLTQARFAAAMGISVHTLRNWEQGRRQPDGPAIALLRIAARHPRIIRENLQSAA
jgi:uncharacterized DUF497 family protein/DNA-binding transcriptional regulator YiaG